MTQSEFSPLNAETIQNMGFAGFPQGPLGQIEAWSRPPQMRVCPAPEMQSALSQPHADDAAYQRQIWAPKTLIKALDPHNPLEELHTYQHRSSWKLMMQLLLHYTRPGDLVLDGMCGSGTSGVAAQLCISSESIQALGYRLDGPDQKMILDPEGQILGERGQRRALLMDLSPLAVVQAYSVNCPPHPVALKDQGKSLLARMAEETGWLYLSAPPGKSDLAAQLAAELEKAGSLEDVRACMLEWQSILQPVYKVQWGPWVQCPWCQAQIALWREEVLLHPDAIKQARPICSSCRESLDPETVTFLTTDQDALQLHPLLITFREIGRLVQKLPDRLDQVLQQTLQRLSGDLLIPDDAVPDSFRKGISGCGHALQTLRDLHLPRSLFALSWLREQLSDYSALPLSCFPEMAARMSLLRGARTVNDNRSSAMEPRPNQSLKQPIFPLLETHPERLLQNYLERFQEFLQKLPKSSQENPLMRPVQVCVASLGEDLQRLVPPDTVDFVFLDPPYPAELTHADSNFLAESWMGVHTARLNEMMVSADGRDDYRQYQQQLQQLFRALYTALKPGRWICLMMSEKNPQNWAKNIFTLALEKEGFVVVSRQTGIITLDVDRPASVSLEELQKQEDFRLISAYKPAFNAGLSLETQVGQFITDYLQRIPLIYPNRSRATLPIERNCFELERRVSHYLLGQPFLRLFNEPPTEAEIRAQIQAFIQNKLVREKDICFLLEQYRTIQQKYGSVSNMHFPRIHSALLKDFKVNADYLIQDLRSWLNKPRTTEDVERYYYDFLRFNSDEPMDIDFRKILSQYFVQRTDGCWRLPEPAEEAQLSLEREAAWQREFEQALQQGEKKLEKLSNQVLLTGIQAAMKRFETDILEQFKHLQLIPYERIFMDQHLLFLFDKIRYFA